MRRSVLILGGLASASIFVAWLSLDARDRRPEAAAARSHAIHALDEPPPDPDPGRSPRTTAPGTQRSRPELDSTDVARLLPPEPLPGESAADTERRSTERARYLAFVDEANLTAEQEARMRQLLADAQLEFWLYLAATTAPSAADDHDSLGALRDSVETRARRILRPEQMRIFDRTIPPASFFANGPFELRWDEAYGTPPPLVRSEMHESD